MQVIATVKGWGKKLVTKAAQFVGKYTDPVLVDENQQLREVYALAVELIEAQDSAINGLNAGFAALELRNETNTRNAMNTLACVLTVLGGEVTVTKDTIEAVNNGDWGIDFVVSEDGASTSIQLLDEQELDALEELANATAGDDQVCDDDCDCEDAEFTEKATAPAA